MSKTGIEELDKLQDEYATGKIDLDQLCSRLWNTAYNYGKKEAGQQETIIIGMTGEVVKMGTMFVDDELLTGVFVMCDPDEFSKQTTNILYRNVKIVPFDECE